MARRDKIHNAVKNALIKDGWVITADPYHIKAGDIQVYADLAADRPIADVVKKYGVDILVVNTESEKVEQWIS
jgi:hypothetical protein